MTARHILSISHAWLSPSCTSRTARRLSAEKAARSRRGRSCWRSSDCSQPAGPAGPPGSGLLDDLDAVAWPAQDAAHGLERVLLARVGLRRVAFRPPSRSGKDEPVADPARPPLMRPCSSDLAPQDRHRRCRALDARDPVRVVVALALEADEILVLDDRHRAGEAFVLIPVRPLRPVLEDDGAVEPLRDVLLA